MNFSKNLLAAILGNLIAFGLLFVLLLMGIAGLASVASVAAPQGKQSINEESVLRLRLNEVIYDRLPSIEQFNVSLGLEPEAIGLDQVVHSIRAAAKEENIKGISEKTVNFYVSINSFCFSNFTNNYHHNSESFFIYGA